MTLAERKAEMRKHWAEVANIHADIDDADWVAHQIVRFVYEGHVAETRPLLAQLKKLAPNAARTQAIELLLKSEESNPRRSRG